MKQIINVFILTTVLLITGTTSFAQEADRQADAVQYDFSTFTINGFEVAGPEYTEQDIIRVFRTGIYGTGHNKSFRATRFGRL